MSVLPFKTTRIRHWPYPSTIENIDDVKSYLGYLYSALEDESVARLGDLNAISNNDYGIAIVSYPGPNEYRVKNIRLNASLNLVITYEDVAGGNPGIVRSSSGAAEHMIYSLRLNSSKDMVVAYDDVAAERLCFIESIPSFDEYRIVGLRLDQNKEMVVTYDETPIL